MTNDLKRVNLETGEFYLNEIFVHRFDFSRFFINRDKSIPAVESVALDERSILELDDLSRIVVDQTNREIMASQQDGQADDDVYHVETECQAPEVCTEFQTARYLVIPLKTLKGLHGALASFLIINITC